MDLFDRISPHSQDWRAMKTVLLGLRETRIQQLLGDQPQDKTNELRGAIRLIDLLLKAEEAAIQVAAYRG